MERLTKKIDNYYDSSNDEWYKMENKKINLNYVFELEQKLGQLEDIIEKYQIESFEELEKILNEKTIFITKKYEDEKNKEYEEKVRKQIPIKRITKPTNIAKRLATNCALYELDKIDNNMSNYAMIMNKLGGYEDIEEELGVDLITLFKALKNGFYTKKAHYSGYGMGVSITQKCLWDEKWQDDIYYFKDYGKTWALSKEELK